MSLSFERREALLDIVARGGPFAQASSGRAQRCDPAALAAAQDLVNDFGRSVDRSNRGASPSASPGPQLRRYEQFSGTELATIEHADPATFAALRKDWIARGEPGFAFVAGALPPPAPAAMRPSAGGERYEELSGNRAAELEHADPAAFAALRKDWIARGEPSFGGL